MAINENQNIATILAFRKNSLKRSVLLIKIVRTKTIKMCNAFQ